MVIDVLGIYPVEAPEPCHIIELMIREHIGVLDVGAFTQESPDQPPSNWQVPWDERILNADGTKDVLGQFPAQIKADGTPLRLVFFFHYLDFHRPLMTPTGKLALEPPVEKPDRLAFLEYESPC
jgi:hypothetical protein